MNTEEYNLEMHPLVLPCLRPKYLKFIRTSAEPPILKLPPEARSIFRTFLEDYCHDPFEKHHPSPDPSCLNVEHRTLNVDQHWSLSPLTCLVLLSYIFDCSALIRHSFLGQWALGPGVMLFKRLPMQITTNAGPLSLALSCVFE